jgi:two-component system, OmpR family, sensor histidine kinase KdpD
MLEREMTSSNQARVRLRLRRAAAWTAVPVALAAVTAAGRAAGASATSIGFLYLVAVLGLATWGGGAVGAAASVAAVLCFNYFFLPPHGTLAIADPANWVALACFFAASTLASRLVASARRRAEEAQRRRREVEVLYELCFGLFTASQRPGVLGEAVARTLAAIGAGSGKLVLLGPGGETEVASEAGEDRWELDGAAVARTVERRQAEAVSGEGVRTLYLPLEVGGLLSGVLAVRGDVAPRSVLDPACRLLALAIERERLLAAAAHLQAVRESDALKTSLLRAVSHDLRTPLTAMRLEVESLERRLADRPEALAGLGHLAVEHARLARRIDNLLALARLEAGLARPHPEPMPVGSLLRAARESLAPLLAGREVSTRVTPGCPDVWVDPSLALEVLVNLLENAARAAPPGSRLELTAGADPRRPGRLRLEVLDRGPGVPPAVRRLPGELPQAIEGNGDAASGGLGLRIAASFAEASGGALELLDRSGGGTVARLTLPIAVEPTGPPEPAETEAA